MLNRDETLAANEAINKEEQFQNSIFRKSAFEHCIYFLLINAVSYI